MLGCRQKIISGIYIQCLFDSWYYTDVMGIKFYSLMNSIQGSNSCEMTFHLGCLYLKSTVLWDMTPHSVIDKHQYFRDTCYLQLQGRRVTLAFFSLKMEAEHCSEMWYLSTEIQSIPSQKVVISIFTGIRTSNIICL